MKETECAMKLSRCLTPPARHTTATNGLYFALKATLQMLVSVEEMWSMSGALTASGESLSLTALTVWSDAVTDPPPASCLLLCSAVDSWHPPRTTGEIGVSDPLYQTNVARAQSCVAAFDSCFCSVLYGVYSYQLGHL